MTSHINLEGGVGVAKVDIGWTAPLALVFQTLDSTIHWINHYPADKCWGNQLCYSLDRFLSGV